MKDLIHILEISQSKNGADFPLTVGHLLNICKKAEKLKQKNLEREAYLETKQHWEIMNAINNHGQD